MPARDPRVDAYIARVRDFARPILEHLRKVIQQHAPELTETIKWGLPFYVGKGPVCHFAAFQKHAVFGFWKGKRFLPEDAKRDEAMGSFGRILTVRQLPSTRRLAGYLRKAIELDAARGRPAATPIATRKPAAKQRALATSVKRKPTRAR